MNKISIASEKYVLKKCGECAAAFSILFSAYLITAQALYAQTPGERADLKSESLEHGISHMPPDRKKQMEDRIEDLKAKLKECHQGKRNDGERYIILKRLLQTYGMLNIQKSPEALTTKKEWDELRQKHPNIGKGAPFELSEEREMLRKSIEKEERVSIHATNFSPKDIRARVFWSGNLLAAVYQYRIEFYALPDTVKPFREYANSLKPLSSGAWQGATVEVKFLKDGKGVRVAPSKVITFGKKIGAVGGCKRASEKCGYFAIYTERIYEDYAFNDADEREVLIHLKRQGKPYQWNNSEADYQEFYGVVSVDGKVLGQVPFKSEYPKSILQALVVDSDGTALFGIGSAVKNEEDLNGAEYLRFGDVKEVFIWSKAGVERQPLKEAMEKYPVLSKSLWLN